MFFPIKDYNPTRRTAVITILFIVINAAVFVYQSYISDKPFEYHIGRSSMVPYEVTHLKNVRVPVGQDRFGRVYGVDRDISPVFSLFSSMFMHGSFMHLFGNMLFLWIFGNNIEDRLGIGKFIFFYLACGVGAGLCHVLFNFNSLTPVVGASGAVSGIMGAYLILYPQARVKTMVFIVFIVTFIDIPAKVFLLIWFVFQFLYVGAGSGVAWLAHVGGFLIGILLIKLLQNKPKPPPYIRIIQ
ncbi:MAG: rhomboid family intramembrane serine protease [bacterium]|nr:rhomboid family intramembrane serine protease [bacterium]